MSKRVKRNYAQQFVALVKHRKKNVPDAEQFVDLFNGYLLQYGIKPLSVDVVKALEDDVNGGVSQVLQAYLSFFGTRLVIEKVAKSDYGRGHDEQMAREDDSYIRGKQECIDHIRITNAHGPNKPRMLRMRVELEDGLFRDIYLKNFGNAAAWDKIKEGMLIILRDDIEERAKEAAVRKSKMSAPKPLKGV